MLRRAFVSAHGRQLAAIKRLKNMSAIPRPIVLPRGLLTGPHYARFTVGRQSRREATAR
jgi:hypothetical protein